MNILTKLSSSDLAVIAKAVQQKEALLAQIAEIDRQLAAIGTGAPEPSQGLRRNPGRPPKSATAVGGRRGKVKEQIINALKAAGATGITVPELASQLGMKVANVRAWIYTTGKKVVKPVKRGVFALKGDGIPF